MNSKTLFLFIAASILLSSCHTGNTKIISIRSSGSNASLHVKFKLSIMTGETFEAVEAETPYTMSMTNKAFMITAVPIADSLMLTMTISDEYDKSSKVVGTAHTGTVYYMPPDGGPGYSGSSK